MLAHIDFGPIFAGIPAVGVLLAGILIRQRALATVHWPVTEGTVVGYHLGPEGKALKHGATVMYKYSVSNREYLNDQISIEGQLTRASWATTILENHPIGSTISVYYDPARPQSSVLVTGSQGGWLLMVIGGLVLCGAAFATVWNS